MKRLIMALACMLAWQAAAAEKADWLTDLPKAQAQAKTENKLVLMDFTGSDWCHPCMELRKNVLDSPEFTAYAKTNLVLVEVDFPQRKKQSEELMQANKGLSEKFEIEGYPTIILLDADGKQLSKAVGYGGEKPAEFIGKLEEAKKKKS
jgi:protein disulfide-isomerase